jgi:hypothetical protein
MKRTALVAALLCVALAGCKTHTAIFTEPDRLAADDSKYPGQATVHVFRDSGRVNAMYAFPVALDTKKVGSIRRERYLVFPAAAGEHVITISCPISCAMPAHTLKFTATAGKSYYFVFESDMYIGGAVGGGLNVSTETAVAQINPQRAEQLMLRYEPGKSVDEEGAAN